MDWDWQSISSINSNTEVTRWIVGTDSRVELDWRKYRRKKYGKQVDLFVGLILGFQFCYEKKFSSSQQVY